MVAVSLPMVGMWLGSPHPFPVCPPNKPQEADTKSWLPLARSRGLGMG